jgi:hypothetical protein
MFKVLKMGIAPKKMTINKRAMPTINKNAEERKDKIKRALSQH